MQQVGLSGTGAGEIVWQQLGEATQTKAVVGDQEMIVAASLHIGAPLQLQQCYFKQYNANLPPHRQMTAN
jgi:hypothetical protein